MKARDVLFGGAIMFTSLIANAEIIQGVDISPYSDYPTVVVAVEKYREYLEMLSEESRQEIKHGADCRIFFDKADPKRSAPLVVNCNKATYGVSNAVKAAELGKAEARNTELAQRVKNKQTRIDQLEKDVGEERERLTSYQALEAAQKE